MRAIWTLLVVTSAGLGCQGLPADEVTVPFHALGADGGMGAGPTWSAAAAMHTARTRAAAARLADGRILVAGGLINSTPTPSSEIYDPVADTWTTTGPLHVAMAKHAAIPLADGRVLAIGGLLDTPSQGSGAREAEVFDPATSTWSALPGMITGRGHPSAALLHDGRVLVAGGIDGLAYGSAAFARSAEIFDPVSRTWTATAELPAPAPGPWPPTGAPLPLYTLPSGKALLVYQPGQAALYDPSLDLWTAPQPGYSDAQEFTSTLLPGGKVLTTGGLHSTLFGTNYFLLSQKTTQLYDPSTDTWSPAAPLGTPRSAHAATLLDDGRVLVAGGVDVEGVAGKFPTTQLTYLHTSEVYDPVSDTWQPVASPLVSQHAYAALVSSGARALFADPPEAFSLGLASAPLGSPCASGAACASGYCADGVCCDTACAAGSCDACSVAQGAASDGHCALLDGTSCDDGHACTTGDTCHQGACAGTKVKDGTSCQGGNACLTAYACAAGSCVGTAPIACAPPGVCHEAGVCDHHDGTCSFAESPYGKLCQAGKCEEQAVCAPIWTAATGQSLVARDRPGAVRLADGRVLVAGGVDAKGQVPSFEEIFDPAQQTWTAVAPMPVVGDRPHMLLLADGRVAAAVGSQLAVYDAAADRWTTAALAPVDDLGARTLVLLADGTVMIPGLADPSGPGGLTGFYDPVADSWSLGSPSQSPRSHFATVTLPDHRVLVAGGSYQTSAGAVLDLAGAEIFDPATRSWSPAGALQAARSSPAAILAGDTVVVAGGMSLSAAGDEVDRFDISTGAWSTAAAAPLANISPRFTVVAGGKVLYTGYWGLAGSHQDEAFLYDPVADTWTETLSFSTTRIAPSVVALADGRALAIGGFGENAKPLKWDELYTPPAWLPQGAACAFAAQCQSGACVDGVCCNAACAGPCQACSAQKGASADGSCTDLPASQCSGPPDAGADGGPDAGTTPDAGQGGGGGSDGGGSEGGCSTSGGGGPVPAAALLALAWLGLGRRRRG